jgi:hypothetical protein
LEGFNEFVWSMKFLIRPNALSEWRFKFLLFRCLKTPQKQRPGQTVFFSLPSTTLHSYNYRSMLYMQTETHALMWSALYCYRSITKNFALTRPVPNFTIIRFEFSCSGSQESHSAHHYTVFLIRQAHQNDNVRAPCNTGSSLHCAAIGRDIAIPGTNQ